MNAGRLIARHGSDEAQVLDAGRGLPRRLLVGGQHCPQGGEDVLPSLLAGASLAERAGTSSTRATIQLASSG
jgi:hypothetical protein